MNRHHKLRRKEAFTGFLFCLPSNTGSSKFAGLKNYTDVLNSAAFRLAAWNTLRHELRS